METIIRTYCIRKEKSLFCPMNYEFFLKVTLKIIKRTYMAFKRKVMVRNKEKYENTLLAREHERSV